MTGQFSNNLRAGAFFFIALLALTNGCHNHPATPKEAAVSSDEVSRALIGKQITVHGKFSLVGKAGPYVTLDNRQTVYIQGGTWGPLYSEMEGKRVAATGVLKLFHEAPSITGVEQVPPDYFYFGGETAQVRLDTPKRP